MTKEEAIKIIEDARAVVLCNGEYEKAMRMAIDALKTEPTKHGRWIFGERMPFGVNVFAVKCSECGYNTITDGLRHKYFYCPNCGAQMMDEVEE